MINLAIFHPSEFVIDSFKLFCAKHESSFALIKEQNNERSKFVFDGNIDIIIMSSIYFLNKENEEFTRQIISDNVKLILLGHTKDDDSITYFLSSGANCYLKECESFDTIREAILIVNRSGLFCPYDVAINKVERKFSLKPTFTERELQVFDCLRKEMTNKEVSEILNLHIKTIDYHRKNIIEKCGSKNLLGALDYLIASGTIPVIAT